MKKYIMKRKTKAVIGIIVCLVLAAANIALSNNTWTKQAALEDLMDYYATGELEMVSPLPEPTIKNRGRGKFFLMENENCFSLLSISHHYLDGWRDGPCLIVEKDADSPIIAAYNSYSSAQDEDKELLRVFGLINDDSISHVEAEVYFAVTGAEQTLEKLTLKSFQYYDHKGQRYFSIDHIYVDKLSEHLMPPFVINGYNDAGELVFSDKFSYGQSTSIG